MVTKMIEGLLQTEYLEYIIAKGGKFVDNEKYPIRKIWGGNKEMMNLLYRQ